MRPVFLTFPFQEQLAMSNTFSELVAKIDASERDLETKATAADTAATAAEEAETIAAAKATELTSAQDAQAAALETLKADAQALVDALNPKASARRR
jgi:G3E family GTPase